jgi:hypothetical protein
MKKDCQTKSLIDDDKRPYDDSQLLSTFSELIYDEIILHVSGWNASGLIILGGFIIY